MKLYHRIPLLGVFLLFAPAEPALGEWAEGLFPPATETGTSGDVNAMVVFDDGSGPALYAGGSFTTAGGVAANNIARWDGTSWTPLGNGTEGQVAALEVFDDGGGPALYAGGAFTTAGDVEAPHIARWDGGSWTPLGSGTDDHVHVLEVFDDGSGPALYAGGWFTTAGGVAAAHIARWDGSSWTPLGSGIDGRVSALEVFDDGGGPALYTRGSGTLRPLARWDGSSWESLGYYLSSPTVFDDGDGPALYGFNLSYLVRWDGSEKWNIIAENTAGRWSAMAALDDGTGPALYIGVVADFIAEGVETSGIVRWDGRSFSPLGSGTDRSVRAMAVYDDGSGPSLYAGGAFTTAGDVEAPHIARWDGTNWYPLGRPADQLNDSVSALAVFDNGEGPALYLGGGRFRVAGRVPIHHVARWDGSSFSPLGSGTDDDVHVLEGYDDGNGPALYAGGEFTTAGGVAAAHIARWDGSSWTSVGGGIDGVVNALAVFDDGGGPALYAGGYFNSAGGVAATSGVARWDGSSWAPLGSGTDPYVTALASLDDGSGPALYAGGEFTTAGGVPASSIARWDGKSWMPLGGGLGVQPGAATVRGLAVFDDGNGPALYAGGNFQVAPWVLATGRIARWDGSSWASVGGGIEGATVSGLAVFDNGTGPALYAVGSFHTAGAVAAANIARWDGSSWAPLGSGTDGAVNALAVFDDGGGPALWVGGSFSTAGDGASPFLAKWEVPTGGPTFRRGDCNDDGAVDISDAICILGWLFLGDSDPDCVATTNTNGDEDADLSDSVYLLTHLFLGGPAPADPFPDCGPGPLSADEEIGCEAPPGNCR